MAQKDSEEAVSTAYYLMGDEETSRDEIIDRFSQNSQRYDKIMEAVNHMSPTLTAQTTAELFPSNRKDVYILDVAAGTGLCAEKLYSHGFQKMDALEPSNRMLDEAMKKGLYGRYFIEALGESALNIANDTYDAVTISAMSSMVLIKLPKEAFEELIRIVKPGGFVINTAFSNVLSDGGDANAVLLRENMKTLEDQGKWKHVELKHFPHVVLGNNMSVSVHKVLT
ncbi:methyltransferase-like protein 27 [Haliotis asinina]|uniref:methyltransferase-like protein 27 n=1 Tax=Haliotis asinina TaxID=109174 RepID=UPI003531E66C